MFNCSKLFIVFLCSYCFSFSQSDSLSILWSQNYKLQWNDFKDNPGQDTDAVAITASGITFGYSIKRSQTEIVEANFTVESHFYPEHSWYKKNRVNIEVLNHERFHFNITELFARKFRKRISETTFTLNIRDEADAIYKSINKELIKMQKAYDTATNYSMNIEVQAEWQKKITKQLELFSKYKLEI